MCKQKVVTQIVICVCVFLGIFLFTACNKEDRERRERDAEVAEQAKIDGLIQFGSKKPFTMEQLDKGTPLEKTKDNDVSLMEDEETSTISNNVQVPPGMVFKIGNDFEVFNGGTAPTFTIDKSYNVTELWTYHWNSGKGSIDGGTMSITSSDGKIYGPWQVEVRNKVYWIAKLNIVLPAGTYTVNDSDPDTLAKNKESNDQGHAWMYGTVAK